MGITITDGIIAAAFVGLLAYLAKKDRNTISESILHLTESVEGLVEEMKQDRKERAAERHLDLARVAQIEAQLARLKGEHDAQMSIGGHAHRRSSDE